MIQLKAVRVVYLAIIFLAGCGNQTVVGLVPPGSHSATADTGSLGAGVNESGDAGLGSSGGSGGTTGSGAGTGGGSGSGGLSPDQDCTIGSLATITDDFNDGTVAAVWSSYETTSGIRVSETNGELKVAPDTDQSGFSYAGYRSNNYLSFSNSQVAASMRIANGTTVLVDGFIDLIPNDGFGVGINLREGTLALWKRVNFDWEEVEGIPYDAVAHKWIRLRESSGTVYCEYSADGTQWTSLATVATNSVLNSTSVKIEVGAGTYGAASNPASFYFDDFNLAPSSPCAN